MFTISNMDTLFKLSLCFLLTFVNCKDLHYNEPTCFSWYDFAQKLLERTITAELKVNHMEASWKQQETEVNRLKSEIAGDRAEMEAGVSEVINTAQDHVARMSRDLLDFQAKVNTSIPMQIEGQVSWKQQETEVNRLKSEIAGDRAEMKAGVSEVINTAQDQVARMSRDLRDFQAKVNKSIQLQIEGQASWKQQETEVNRLKSEIAGDRAEMKAGVSQVINRAQVQVARMSRDLRDFQAKVTKSIQLQIEGQDVGVGGAVYIRWGRTVCPEDSTSVYAALQTSIKRTFANSADPDEPAGNQPSHQDLHGIAAGSLYSNRGGSSTTICLPDEPIFGNHYSGGSSSYTYGTKYQDGSQTAAIFGRNVHNEDVPCVVCEATGRRSKMLVPARNVCYSGWHLEYSGYLMTSHYSLQRTNMECVDNSPETINGQSANDNGNLFYFVEANGQIPDPPYTRAKELTCAICTK